MTLAEHAEQSVDDVLAGRVILNPDVFKIGGFCGKQSRELVNRLCRPAGTRYLEVGVLHGAMFCSALSGNSIRAVGIDNFSQFDGEDGQTRRNLHLFDADCSIRLINRDAFSVPPGLLGGPFDVFFYDADHSREATAKALSHFLPALSEPFIFLADDYLWPQVREGVCSGIIQAGLSVLWDRALLPEAEGDADLWNGLYLAVLTRE